jgi:hypothetical protein
MAAGNGVTIAVSLAAGLLIGGGGGYLVAGAKFNEQVAALTQAANAQIQKGNEVQKALALPDLPLRVNMRKALMGAGEVAQLQNFGGRELVVAVVAHSPATNQSREWRLVIAPGTAQELGHKEGWAFASGDELSITDTAFRPMKVNVP